MRRVDGTVAAEVEQLLRVILPAGCRMPADVLVALGEGVDCVDVVCG